MEVWHSEFFIILSYYIGGGGARGGAAPLGRDPSPSASGGMGYQPAGPSRQSVGSKPKPAYAERRKGPRGRRKSIPDNFRPVTTEGEKALFWELFPKFTNGQGVTNWFRMRIEWSLRVVEAKANGHMHDVFLKSENELKDYEDEVKKVLAKSTVEYTSGLLQAAHQRGFFSAPGSASANSGPSVLPSSRQAVPVAKPHGNKGKPRTCRPCTTAHKKLVGTAGGHKCLFCASCCSSTNYTKLYLKHPGPEYDHCMNLQCGWRKKSKYGKLCLCSVL